MVGMDNLVVDVAVLMKIRSRSQVVVVDDDAAANAVQHHERDNDAVEHYLLLVHLSPFLTENQMHPDDVHDVGLRGCSGNDLDCHRRIIVTRHEHPRWNRNQCLVWSVIEIHQSHGGMPWRVLIPAIKKEESRKKPA